LAEPPKAGARRQGSERSLDIMRKMVYLDMWLFVWLEAIYRHMPIVNMRKFATAAPDYNLRRPE
jgi:hypothetical protein